MSETKEQKEGLPLSRRRFFASAGTFLAGAAVTATGCSALMTRKEASAETAAKWPLPYSKLDPEDLRKRGYVGYYNGD